MHIANFYNFVIRHQDYVIDGVVFYFDENKNYMSHYAYYTKQGHWIINDIRATERMCLKLYQICLKRNIKQDIIDDIKVYNVDKFMLLTQIVKKYLIYD